MTVPFRSEDTPWWDEHDVPVVPPPDGPPPVLPAELAVPLHTADRLDADRLAPCGCACCTPPAEEPVGPTVARELVADAELAVTFGRHWTLAQQHTGRAWQAASLLHARAQRAGGTAAAEHVGSDLALLMNAHPRTGQALLLTAMAACEQVPELVALVLSGQLGVKHVEALLAAAATWTTEPEQAATVIRLTLEGCQSWLERYGWPTPAELRKRLAKVAILHDLQALAKRKKSIADARGVNLLQTGVGKACLSVEGPELMLLQAYRAIQARAHAMGRLPGDERSTQQRLHDAALELLHIDVNSDGSPSVVPTTGLDGEPVTITVRGLQIVVLAPYSVLEGGDLELAEIDGYGPILPATARELAAQAESFRRVAIDADTGQVITVDDATPTRRRTRPESAQAPVLGEGPGEGPEGDEGQGWRRDDGPDDRPPPAPAGGGATPDPESRIEGEHPTALAEQAAALARARDTRALAALLRSTEPPDPPAPVGEPPPSPALLDRDMLVLLRALVDKPVRVPDLSTHRYRIPGRLRRTILVRDRTCRFPGCTVPAQYLDIDHRDEWPRGGTHEQNLHALCRRHHRAKQAYFTVTLDTSTHDTCWTTPDGRTYRRPPPTY